MKLHDALKICEVDKLITDVIVRPNSDKYSIIYQADDGVLGNFSVSISENIDITKPIFIHDVKKVIANTKLKFNKMYLQDDIQLIIDRDSGSSSLLYESAMGKSIYQFNPPTESSQIPKLTIDNYWLGVLYNSLSSEDSMKYIRVSTGDNPNDDDISYLPITFSAYENSKNDYRTTNVNIVGKASSTLDNDCYGYSVGTFDFNQFIKILKANRLAYSCDITIYIGVAMVMSFVYGNDVNEVTIFSN